MTIKQEKPTECKNEIVVVDRDFMNLAHQAFMLCAHLLDDWEEFFPALHLVWDKHAQEIFPYELCEYMDDMRDILKQLEKLAEKEMETVFSGVVGEA